MSDDDTALHLPAQAIPVPKSISPQGQAFWAAAARRLAAPQTEDMDARIAAMVEGALQQLRPIGERFKGTVETIILPSGAELHRIIPEGRSGRLAEVTYFDIHGGGFSAGGGEMCRLLGLIKAGDLGGEVYVVDYRLLPDHPYPASLDDCMAAYREVLKRTDPANLVVGGASAGGNLVGASMLRARDEGLPLPAALLMLTPVTDVTQIGDTYATNRLLDANLRGNEGAVVLYGKGQDCTHPYVSPLFDDFTKGWPPTFLSSGTRDLLLSDTVRMHRALRRAGVDAVLHVFEASPHGGFMGSNSPEDRELMGEIRRYIRSAWGVDD